MNVYLIIVLSLYFILYIAFAYKNGKFFKNIFLSATVGSAIYLALHYFGEYFGVIVPLNIYALSVSAFMGLPGVVLILLCNFIF